MLLFVCEQALQECIVKLPCCVRPTAVVMDRALVASVNAMLNTPAYRVNLMYW